MKRLKVLYLYPAPPDAPPDHTSTSKCASMASVPIRERICQRQEDDHYFRKPETDLNMYPAAYQKPASAMKPYI